MRDRAALAMTLLLALVGAAVAQDDEQAKKIAAQKKAAEAAWLAVEAGDMASAETKHLLIYAPKSMEKRLKGIGVLLEKYHDSAVRAVAVKPEEAYPGKITIYLFAEREQLPAFARRVEKRRPTAGETASFSAGDDRLHAAAVPGTGKNAVPVEALAGEQLAAVLLMRRAGVRTAVPDWLVHGFGRATSYRVQSAKEKFVMEDRKLARVLVRKHDAARAVWSGTLEPEEAECLQGSLAEMLAYGPGAKRFPKFVEAFKPAENVLTKTTAQAFEDAGISPDRIGKLWKSFVR